MAFDLYKGRIVKREVECQFLGPHRFKSFQKDFLVFIPWDQAVESNLMYQLKGQIIQNGRALIPFVNADFSKVLVDASLRSELISHDKESDREIHLVMSNKASIHVFRIRGVLNLDDLNSEKLLNIFSGKDYDLIFEVDDVFVLEANHFDDEEKIIERLDEILENGICKNIFKPTFNFQINFQDNNDDKWVSKERSLTYEYLVRSRELKNNIFHDDWDILSVKTQHEMISCELKKQKALRLRGQDKWYHLVQAFLNYEKALISELNDIYIFPILRSLSHFESLAEAWKISSNCYTNRGDTEIIYDLFEGKRSEVNSIDEFIEFVQSAKSVYYGLKKQFTKKIYKEEFLIVENFLAHQEGLVDSFNCKKISERLKLITEIKQWINIINSNAQLSCSNQNEINLKLSHFLSILVSTNADENIFYHLIAEKIGRAVYKCSLKDQVKFLIGEFQVRVA